MDGACHFVERGAMARNSNFECSMVCVDLGVSCCKAREIGAVDEEG